MVQDPESYKSKCPIRHCKAPRGVPCRTRAGTVAKKVHHGRKYWSSKVGKPFDPNA